MSAVASIIATNGAYRIVSIPWTSDASGDASCTIPSKELGNGCSWGFCCQPGTAGDQPSDNFDVTIVDSRSIDVLAGAGLNRSNAAATYAGPEDTKCVPIVGDLTFAVANAGNAKSGTFFLHVQSGR